MNNTVMKDVAKAENAFTSDETMRYKYMLREKAIRDYYSGLDDTKQEGIEIGIKQGREQGLAQGREQGLTQGREQGLAQGAQQEKIANILGHVARRNRYFCDSQDYVLLSGRNSTDSQ